MLHKWVVEEQDVSANDRAHSPVSVATDSTATNENTKANVFDGRKATENGGSIAGSPQVVPVQPCRSHPSGLPQQSQPASTKWLWVASVGLFVLLGLAFVTPGGIPQNSARLPI